MTANATDQLPDPWPAPLPDGPLRATVHLPGSKSLTNRYLVLAAVAEGPGTLRGALLSRDTLLMVAALRAMGVEITTDPSAALVTVRPGPLRAHGTVDAGLAGTVMRFLPPLAALATGTVTVDGDPQAAARPMGPLLRALRELGVTVHGDALPFTITGTGAVEGGPVDIDASASSQFVSGLLLAAPRYRRGLTVRHTGTRLPSLPHIEMTVAVLREAGVAVDDSRPGIWQVSPGPVAAMDVRIEPDLSNAGPFLAAALVAGGTVRVPGWPQATTQPGDLLRDLLHRMGGTVELSDGVLSVTGTGVVHGIDVDLHAAGELAPTVAAAAALADSPTRLRGIGHLRGHETDRLAALATEITALGGRAEQTRDGLVITPRPLRGGLVRTYHDHRLATAAALIGLGVPGVLVQDVATTDKTLPGFAALWHRMLGR